MSAQPPEPNSARKNLIVAGLDPGLSTGGLVLWDGKKILSAHSYVIKPSERKMYKEKAKDLQGDRTFSQAVLRAYELSERIIEDITTLSPDAIGIESFVDQRHRAREEKAQLIKDRWKTPLLIGALLPGLQDLGYSEEEGTLIWGSATTVLRHMGPQIDALEHAIRGKHDGLNYLPEEWSKLKNDHLRKAWAHAAWTYERVRVRQKENKEKM